MTGTVSEVDVDLTLAELRDALRSYLADGAALTEVRAVAEGHATGFDRDRWNAISSSLGIGALVVGEPYGGLGLDLRHACVAAEVMGESLCPSPVRTTLVAAMALTDAVAAGPSRADDPRARWLENIATQAASATVALDPDPHIRLQVSMDDAIDVGVGDMCAVSGSVAIVENGVDADHMLVWADGGGSSSNRTLARAGALVGVDLSGGVGVTRTRLASTDVATEFARIELDRCPAVILGDRSALDRVTQQALVLRAAEQVGLARGALAMATEHARRREQFGRIIGSYQAISHRLAQTAVDIEGAAGLVTTACAACIDASEPERADALAPLAAAIAARVSSSAADTVIQVLGGIGFTWEHDAQFYFRRIKSLAVWMGSADALDDLAARRQCHRMVRG